MDVGGGRGLGQREGGAADDGRGVVAVGAAPPAARARARALGRGAARLQDLARQGLAAVLRALVLLQAECHGGAALRGARRRGGAARAAAALARPQLRLRVLHLHHLQLEAARRSRHLRERQGQKCVYNCISSIVL